MTKNQTDCVSLIDYVRLMTKRAVVEIIITFDLRMFDMEIVVIKGLILGVVLRKIFYLDTSTLSCSDPQIRQTAC